MKDFTKLQFLFRNHAQYGPFFFKGMAPIMGRITVFGLSIAYYKKRINRPFIVIM